MQDGRGGLLHLGKGAADDGDGFGIGVAHGADDGEAVAGPGHVQVAEQRVERLRADERERLIDVGGGADFEAADLQDLGEGIEDGFVIVDKQDPGEGCWFAWLEIDVCIEIGHIGAFLRA